MLRAAAASAASPARAFVFRFPLASGLVLLATLLLAATVRADGRICTSADTLSFGQQWVGTSTSAVVRVANCGDAAFSFTDVSVHAATDPAFRVAASCATGMTLAPSEACTATVFFEPTTPGQASGALWFHNTTVTPDQLLTFYGRAVDATAGSASLVFSPQIVDFGSAGVGSESGPLALTLTNVGTAPLVPSAFVLNGATPYDFVGDLGGASGCDVGKALEPGASCIVALHFHPQATGTRRANLVIDAPQLASLAIVTVSGTGVAANAAVPVATLDVVEFHDRDDDQYFLTADAHEMALLDAGALGAAWSRTGASFKAWPLAAGDATTQPVCRFFGTPGIGPESHFYTAYANECAAVREDPHWIEEGPTFRAKVPQDGACASGEQTVTRLWKPGSSVTGSRHRYVVDAGLAATMQAQGWVLEGAVFCAPR
jgi:HYDIN/CFA65/VesB family protein